MKIGLATGRSKIVNRLLSIVGLAVAGTTVSSFATDNKVFARQFLQTAQVLPATRMIYDRVQQLMVWPSSESDPIFKYSKLLLGGKSNGRYQAPLVTCPGDPSCPEPPPPPSHTVTPNDDPNGAGPTPDSD